MRPRLSQDFVVLILAIAVCRSPLFAGGPQSKRQAEPAPRPAVAGPRQVSPAARPAPPPPPPPLMTWEEPGFGVTEADARKNALESLQTKVRDWLTTNYPEITYSPVLTDVEKMVIEFSPTKVSESKEDRTKEARDGQPMLELKLRAELKKSQLDDFQHRTKQELARHRQGFLAKGLIGAVGLLVVATGYLRLEEKVGRHKGKLGIAAVGLLGLVGLALLVLG